MSDTVFGCRLLLIWLCAVCSACEPSSTGPTGTAAAVARDPAATFAVELVQDGDTVRLRDGTWVRYFGIDSPEKTDPLYREAKEENAKMVRGKPVRLTLEKDPQDRFGRLVAMVYVADGQGHEIPVNVEMVRRGMARVYFVSEAGSHEQVLLDAQREARSAKRGIWALPAPSPEPYYVSTGGPSGKHRFHRPKCIQMADHRNLIRIPTRDQALDEGRSPCRTCKP